MDHLRQAEALVGVTEAWPKPIHPHTSLRGVLHERSTNSRSTPADSADAAAGEPATILGLRRQRRVLRAGIVDRCAGLLEVRTPGRYYLLRQQEGQMPKAA